MSAAWHAWAQWGRPAHRELRVVFAMLAGLAPLHAERLAARGGPAEAVHDPLSAYDTSSYGPRALDAMLRVVGVDRLLYGSDRPVIEPVAVVQGEVAEDRLALGGPAVTRTFGEGEAFSFCAADIHRVRHTGDAPAVTIHAYSPPLWRMGAYEILPGGELRRHAMSYAEELRPLQTDSQ
jgi:hypothetical protein